jgi:type IV pilus assembly protein PilE
LKKGYFMNRNTFAAGAMKRVNGFTLTELMIALAIVAIIAAVAIPSYQGNVQKTRRTEATAALLENAQLLERCFSMRATYEDCVIAEGETTNGYYTLSSELTAATYDLTAAPTEGGTQVEDTHCAQFTLDERGVRGGTNDDCW